MIPPADLLVNTVSKQTTYIDILIYNNSYEIHLTWLHGIWTFELPDLFDIIDVVKSHRTIVLSIFKRVKENFVSVKFIGGKWVV